MEALLDSNFLLTCIKQKIDFFEEIKLMGISIIIPKQVLNELKFLEQRDNSKSDSNTLTALKLLKKEDFNEIDLGDSKTDRAIIKFAKKNPEIIIATLDKELQCKIKNKKLIIRGKKKLEIV